MFSCEHGGNRIPAGYQPFFAGYAKMLQSHRGYDIGALQLAREFAAHFRAPLFYSTTSRLLIDLNRSRGHSGLYSEATRRAPPEVRAAVLKRYYDPYRTDVENGVAAAVERGYRALHLSCHSFTSRLGGAMRRADVGLLYDPAREREGALCAAWQAALQRSRPELVVRRNYPYRGVADGLVTFLRRRFNERDYIGIELEVNQRHPLGETAHWRSLRRALIECFAEALRTCPVR
jgi:predicted N-formylglutamate amidohydrolase